MKLRPLVPSDLDAITALDQLCFSPETAFSRDVFEDALEARSCQSFGIEHNHAIIAFALLHYPDRRAAHLLTIDVHPRYRRQGLADTLMAEIEKTVRAKGIRRVLLQVATDNAPALALYHKWGFSIRMILPSYYGRGKDGYLMERIFMDLKGSP